MMRSLYSAITGLKNHQTSMDVIGNNIANVNTAGYKRQRASFATMLGQEIQGASAPTTAVGGTNGVTIGLGSILGSVDKLMTQGSSQYTGKANDMMIQGDGMFVVSQGGNTYYTRTGNFDLDQAGNLVDVNTGGFVQAYVNTGYPAVTALAATPSNIALTPGMLAGYTLDSYSIDSKGVITGVFNPTVAGPSETRVIGQIALATFSNTAGLNYEGNNFYSVSNNSGAANVGKAGSSGKGDIMTSYLEMSNVDLSQEFTDMIVTQRGFQANSRVITVSDTLLEELINLKRS